MLDEEQKEKVKENLKLLIADLLIEAGKVSKAEDIDNAESLRNDAIEIYQIGERRGYLSSEEGNKIFKENLYR